MQKPRFAKLRPVAPDRDEAQGVYIGAGAFVVIVIAIVLLLTV